MKCEDATKFKSMTTRWEKGWKEKNGVWKMKVRFVGREYKWAEHREDLFSPGATHSAGRIIDFLALKMGLETFEADAVTRTSRLQSTSNASPKLEGTQTLCGDYDVSCPGGVQQVRAGWNTWLELK